MPNLTCSVTNCQYNNQNMCTLDDIKVGNRDSNTSIETVCDSFCQRNANYTSEFASMDSQAKLRADIECSAGHCYFNQNFDCTAQKVCIDNSTKNSSQCATFKK